MQTKLIEKIRNNTRAITLYSDKDGVYYVSEKNGIVFKTVSFQSLTNALEYFNILSERFHNESK